MSKIHDALRRLNNRKLAEMAHARATVDSDVALIPENDDTAGPEWSFCRRQVHIDNEALVSAGLLEPAQSHLGVAAEYKPVQEAVLEVAQPSGGPSAAQGNLAAVCSAVSGDGRTFIALNLAMYLSRDPACSVVLIDCDFDNPQLSHALGTHADPGFTDWVAEYSMDLADFVMPTDVHGLAFVPVGRQHTRSKTRELLANTGLRDRLARIAEEHMRTIFLFDTPAMTTSRASYTIAMLAGQILFVIRAGSTRRSLANEALQHFNRSRPVNIVLNQLATKQQLTAA